MSEQDRSVRRVAPGSFEPAKHFYPRVLNAQIHPLVRHFFALGNRRIGQRYCHLHPEIAPESVSELLAMVPKVFRWGGSDLFATTDERGVRRLVIIETNSCPSGQKSMPLLDEHSEQAGYRVLLEGAFMPYLRSRKLPDGDLAVLYDKNIMEASGYAAVLADLAQSPVFLVPCFDHDDDSPLRSNDDGVLEHRWNGSWRPIRAAIRYVTQRPWSRIPVISRTHILNPVLACLAGGRNKMLAAKAYDLRNADLSDSGLFIRTPDIIADVTKEELPLWVQRMGGLAVVKVPYSNAGQGVWTITNRQELADFMAIDHRYQQFIVQALIGNHGWSSRSAGGHQLFHVGTIPNKNSEFFVADLRFMVGAGPDGFFPVAIYARRARKPLVTTLTGEQSSWDMLGTNLSVRRANGGWDSETERLLLMDGRDFNKVGLGIDDLIEAYIQTVLAVSAIDAMAVQLVSSKGRFRRKLFGSLNPDATLLEEIRA